MKWFLVPNNDNILNLQETIRQYSVAYSKLSHDDGIVINLINDDSGGTGCEDQLLGRRATMQDNIVVLFLDTA